MLKLSALVRLLKPCRRRRGSGLTTSDSPWAMAAGCRGGLATRVPAIGVKHRLVPATLGWWHALDVAAVERPRSMRQTRQEMNLQPIGMFAIMRDKLT